MANAFIPIFCCIVAIITITESDTESTDLLDKDNHTTEANIENTAFTATSNETDGVKNGGRKPSTNKSASKIPKKRTTLGPNASNLPYTLVFYGERKCRRVYPQMSGYVIYRRKPFHREYLVFEVGEKPYYWTPSKGDVEPGETHFERALKELEKDCGLTSDDIIDIPMEKSNFRQYMTNINRKGGKFYVARIIDPNKPIKKNVKYVRYKWLEVQDAMAITDEIGHLMIKKTDNYLEKNGY